MNANGRRVRQFNNGFRHLARICGVHVKGGRRILCKKSGVSIHDAIARERETARRLMQMKVKTK